MQIAYVYRPVQFFLITFLGTWSLWLMAAYCSYQQGMSEFQQNFMLVGLFVPFVVAMAMIFGAKNKELRKDFWDRFGLGRIKISFIPVLLLLMPVTLFLATAISLLFGASTEQFALSRDYEIMDGHCLFSLMVLFLAPLVEELGWRGYGVDSLRNNRTLFKSTLLFAFIWALWHAPLFFIKGYYHYNVWNANLVYAGNFFVSMLPATLLMNWVYYKNNRSITAAILLHFMFNLFSVLFQTEQFTKCIITILLLMVSSRVIIRDKNYFFDLKEYV